MSSHDLQHSPNRGMPMGQFRQPPCYFGCGEYVDWLAYETAAWRREQQAERVARFTECVDLPPDLYAVVDGRVVSARTGEPLKPIRDQIARLQAEQSRAQYIERRRTDAVTLKPILDLFSLVEGT